MPLTALNMRTGAALAVSGAVFGFEVLGAAWSVVGFVALEVIVVLTCRRPKDPALTVQDRATMNQERLTEGKQPGAGTIAIAMYVKKENLPTVDVAHAAMRRAVERFPRFGSVAVATAAIDDAWWRKVEVDMEEAVWGSLTQGIIMPSVSKIVGTPVRRK